MNLNKLFISLVFILLLYSNIFAVDSNELLIKDYHIPVTIPRGKFEVDIDYLSMNDTIDVLNIRDSEVTSNNPGSIGDLDGMQFIFNFGLTSSIMLHGRIATSNIDYGFGNLKTKDFEFSVRYSFYDKIPEDKPLFAIDAGIKYQYADDISTTNVSIMNRYVKTFFGNDYKVYKEFKNNTLYTNFEGPDSNGKIITIGLAKTPYVKIEDMKSYTGFLRISAGKITGDILSVIFLEGGATSIDTEIDSDIKQYKVYKDNIGIKLPFDLGRNERYIELGADFFIKFPHKIIWNFCYSYKRMFRDSNLDYIKYNHIIDTEVNFYITKSFSINIGGKYMHRQFNGEIPYLYNEYTQTTFDHRYGYAKIGFTFLF